MNMSFFTMYDDGAYLDANVGWHETDGLWKANRVHDLLGALALKPRSICDIGCGTGAVLDHLGGILGNDPNLMGFEVSRSAVELAHTKHPGVHILLGKAQEYSEQRFELALVLDVIEHVEDYLGFMRSVRHLADMFIFHIPLDMSVQTVARMSPLMLSRESIGHLHYFSSETARASVEYAGYDIVGDIFTTGSPDHRGSKARKSFGDMVRATGTRLVGSAVTARVLGGFSLLVAARPTETR